MKLSDYIEVLQQTLEEHGDYEVAITQGGYYAEGQFADLYLPPELETREVGLQTVWVDGKSCESPSNKQKFIVLGDSYQSY